MTWVRLDDNSMLHPKVVDAGAEAAWLWACGLGHCNRHVTDGVIQKRHLSSLYTGSFGGKKLVELAAKLVSVDLWIDEGDAYRVKNYDRYQEEALKENVTKKRTDAAARKRAQRDRERLSNKSRAIDDMSRVTGRDMSHVTVTQVSQDDVTHMSHEGVTAVSHVLSQDDLRGGGMTMSHPPDPSLPDPSLPTLANARVNARDSGGRISKDDVARHLQAEYKKRYELAKNDIWMGHPKSWSDIQLVASWALQGEDPIARATKCLEGAFADEWMRGSSWPWGSIARDPGRFYEPPKKSGGIAKVSDWSKLPLGVHDGNF